MRFYLDEDTDVRVSRVLEKHGHQCWNTPQASRLSSEDDDQAVYADNRDAIMVTHDVGFSAKQKRRTVGRHLFFNCPHPDAVNVLNTHMELISRLFEHRGNWVIELKPGSFEFHPGVWGVD